MNVSFLLAGTVSVNPLLLLIAVFIIANGKEMPENLVLIM